MQRARLSSLKLIDISYIKDNQRQIKSRDSNSAIIISVNLRTKTLSFPSFLHHFRRIKVSLFGKLRKIIKSFYNFEPQ